jgi:hypothetical protein
MFGQTEPLDTWNDGAPKEAIVKFVAEVTREGGPQFVPPAERIAVFDNDGHTLGGAADVFSNAIRT